MKSKINDRSIDNNNKNDMKSNKLLSNILDFTKYD